MEGKNKHSEDIVEIVSDHCGLDNISDYQGLVDSIAYVLDVVYHQGFEDGEILERY